MAILLYEIQCKDYKKLTYKVIKISHCENSVSLIAYSVINLYTNMLWFKVKTVNGITVYHACVIIGLYILLYLGKCYNLIEDISILSFHPMLQSKLP